MHRSNGQTLSRSERVLISSFAHISRAPPAPEVWENASIVRDAETSSISERERPSLQHGILPFSDHLLTALVTLCFGEELLDEVFLLTARPRRRVCLCQCVGLFGRW